MHLKPTLQQNKIDGLFVTSKQNVQYLTNFSGSHGKVLLTKSKNYLLTDFRYLEEARKLKRDKIKFEVVNITQNEETIIQKLLKKHKIKKLGYEGDHTTVTKLKKLRKTIKKAAKLTYTTNIIEKLRAIKTGKELKLIQKAQEITHKIFLALKKEISFGQSEKDIAWKIKTLARKFSAQDLAFEPVVAFGKNSACPHHKNTDKKLKKGDLILLDLGVVYKNYHSDMTRIIFTKKPTPLETKIYNLVLKAQQNALSKIKPGITCNKTDSFTRKIIAKTGYEENFQHGSGHGTGLQIHEKPNLCEKNREKLQENMVFTIEPGIYLQGKFGIRIEDLVVLKKGQIKNLTKTSKEIQIIS